MSTTTLTLPANEAELATLSPQQLAQMLRSRDATIGSMGATIESLRAQLEWFKRQIFGAKSERYAAQPEGAQMHLGEHLGELLAVPPPAPEAVREVKPHQRRAARSDFADGGASAPFFDAAKVPVVAIEVPCPQAAGLAPEQYEVVGHKESHRLAQRPGAYVVLKYRRAVIKRLDTRTLHCAPAPVGVIEGSRADVSFAAGVLLDKFQWHLPLYRQHQRLVEAGFTLSRQWLTSLVGQSAGLLQPIYDAQLESIRRCRVKAVDETPIKAGRAGPGKMRAGYFWPVYGEHDEVCFAYFGSREHRNVVELLGPEQSAGAVLLSDGYGAYEAYAKKTGVVHAQCWAHMRRDFHDALSAAPAEADCALRLIAQVYAVEEEIRARKLGAEHKRVHRLSYAKPHVERFFAWADERVRVHGVPPAVAGTQAPVRTQLT